MLHSYVGISDCYKSTAETKSARQTPRWLEDVVVKEWKEAKRAATTRLQAAPSHEGSVPGRRWTISAPGW